MSQIRDLLIDAEDENVGLSQQLLEETHEDLNSLEACLKRCDEHVIVTFKMPMRVRLRVWRQLTACGYTNCSAFGVL